MVYPVTQGYTEAWEVVVVWFHPKIHMVEVAVMVVVVVVAWK